MSVRLRSIIIIIIIIKSLINSALKKTQTRAAGIYSAAEQVCLQQVSCKMLPSTVTKDAGRFW